MCMMVTNMKTRDYSLKTTTNDAATFKNSEKFLHNIQE